MNIEIIHKLVIRRSMKGELVVHGVADENTRHMQDLVARSKNTKRRMPPVKGPTRRPMQHSAQWKPPQSNYSQQQQYRGDGGGGGSRGGGGGGRYQPLQRPFGRGGGAPRGGMGRGIMRMGGEGGGMGGRGGSGMGRGRGTNMNNNNNYNNYNDAPRSPLRKPRDNYRDNYRGPSGGGGGQRQGGGRGGEPAYAKHNKNVKPSKPQHKSPGKVKTNYKRDLEKYYEQKNLGEVQYKVAAVGKGKEKFMATVTVEGSQFKTYPETFNSKVRLTISSFDFCSIKD